jgi:hypothetical protein
MKIWTNLKVSIAGARLSHLVQKDRIWDHGSMTEQVKNVFYQVEKATNKREAELVKKYVTSNALDQIHQLIRKMEGNKPILKNAMLTQVSIIDVNVQTNNKPDRFTAFIRGKRKAEDNENTHTLIVNKSLGIENFSARWYFIRQAEWWMLDSMKPLHSS